MWGENPWTRGPPHQKTIPLRHMDAYVSRGSFWVILTKCDWAHCSLVLLSLGKTKTKSPSQDQDQDQIKIKVPAKIKTGNSRTRLEIEK